MNVLIIGLGSIAKKHINALKSLGDVTIYALRTSRSTDSVEFVHDIFSLDQLGAVKIDFVIISNPTALHKETIVKLIPYKLPLFIEKPLFDQIIEESVINEIRTSKIVTYVACNLRFLDCLVFVKEFITYKRINEVNIYCGSYLPEWRPSIDYKKVYSANKDMGGGVHLDLIHEIDYMFWLFGVPIEVNSVKRSRSSLGINSIDYASYIFEYPDFCINTVLNYYRRDPKRHLEILLTDGTLSVDLLNNQVHFGGQQIYYSEQRIVDTYVDQLRFFIDEVLGKGVEFNTIYDANQVLELCIKEN